MRIDPRDLPKLQRLMHKLKRTNWTRVLGRLARRVNPLLLGRGIGRRPMKPT